MMSNEIMNEVVAPSHFTVHAVHEMYCSAVVSFFPCLLEAVVIFLLLTQNIQIVSTAAK